jgi:hypothetical protein
MQVRIDFLGFNKPASAAKVCAGSIDHTIHVPIELGNTIGCVLNKLSDVVYTYPFNTPTAQSDEELQAKLKFTMVEFVRAHDCTQTLRELYGDSIFARSEPTAAFIFSLHYNKIEIETFDLERFASGEL